MDKGGVSNSSFLIAFYIAVIEQLGFEWILIDKGYSLMGAIYFCLPCKWIKKKNHNAWGFIANCASVMTVSEIQRRKSST